MIHIPAAKVKKKFRLTGENPCDMMIFSPDFHLWRRFMKKIVLKFIRLLVGLAIMSFGSAMALVADLGMEPWDVLNDGMAKFLQGHIGITLPNGADLVTFGRANITIGLIILLIDVLCKEKVGFGTFINILICGNIVDFCTGDMFPGLALLPDYRGLPLTVSLVSRLILCVLSLLPAAFGMYVYMSARLGSGPRDGLMVVLTKRLKKWPVGGIRVLLEGCALMLGWILGGRVGIGTIILVLLSGPVMQVIFKLASFDVRQLRHETIPETVAAIRAALAKENT